MKGKKHFYTSDAIIRGKIHLYLGIVSVGFAYLFGLFCQSYFSPPWWLDTPAIFGFYGILYELFQKRLWTLSWVRKILAIKTPNLNGEYKGILTSSYDNFSKSTNINITIHQTWNRVCISLKGKHSTSTSNSASFHVAENITPILTYHYTNYPLSDAVETMAIHNGMCSIEILDSEILEGEFFTGRGRGTFGKFKVKLLEPTS